MLRRILPTLAVFLATIAPFARAIEPPPNVTIMPESEIRTGMRGVAYTVFEGVKPEPVEVEVLGVLKDMAGPKSDVILARLHGPKVEFTGVVAGMSGSPVYIDGKLVGAIAYRIGEFSKEPIAGITPAASMLEINQIAEWGKPGATAAQPANAATPTSGPGMATAADSAVSGYTSLLKPIDTPLVFSGFSPETLRLFGPSFASAGVVPVMGAGGASNTPQPEPLEPGSVVSAALVQGDMNIAGTCTVTYVDSERLLACGHPFLQSGTVDLPMMKATVLATLPSASNSFKIVNTTEPVGAFLQDRHTGIMGRFDHKAQMIPVTVTLRAGSGNVKQYHFDVLNNPKITPSAVMATVFNALEGNNVYGEDATYRLNGSISVGGYPKLAVQNMYAPSDGSTPTAYGIAVAIGDRFSRIYENPYETPKIDSVELTFDLVPERRSARIENARTDVTEARPGDTVTVEALLRPYRGDSIVRQIPLTLPASTPKGTLRILVSDGDTLDRLKRMPPAMTRKLPLGSTIALLNRDHSNTQVYVSLLEPNPQAMVSNNVMPTLPLSVINVMDGMRASQDMVVVGESATSEASVALDYVVSGAQIITLNIK